MTQPTADCRDCFVNTITFSTNSRIHLCFLKGDRMMIHFDSPGGGPSADFWKESQV